MNRRTALVTVIVSALAMSCVSAGGPVEPAVPARPTPIPIGDSGSDPMVFQSVLFRISSGTVLGEARMRNRVIDELRWSRPSKKSTEFNVAITDAFRGLGYDMRDSADALFAGDPTVKVRYEMAAILHNVELDFEYEYDRRSYRTGDGYGTANVEVEVLLRDVTRGEVIYQRRFEGFGEDRGREPNPTAHAIVDAILRTTSDGDFVAQIAAGSIGSGDAAEEDKSTSVALCRPDSSRALPGAMNSVLDSVVEIRAGNSIGTGVLISPEGWVLTAQHVISGAPEVWVRLGNGIQLPATVTRGDYQADVALLKLDGREFPCTAPRRDSGELEIGSELFVINAALDEGKPTVARGIVAGYPNSLERKLLQTDASLNPGSSGGPIFTSDGSVSAIVISKIVGIGFEGQGFGIPVYDALQSLSIRFTPR